MSKLEGLVNKIIDDARAKAESIHNEAQLEGQKIVDAKVKSANDEKEAMISKAQMEAEIRKQRVVSGAQLEVRNNKLRAKQEVIATVIEEAIAEMEKMNDASYIEFMSNVIAQLDTPGQYELKVPASRKAALTTEVLAELNSKKVDTTLNLSDTACNAEGFVLVKDGIELNFMFKALTNSYRSSLEQEINRAIFA